MLSRAVLGLGLGSLLGADDKTASARAFLRAARLGWIILAITQFNRYLIFLWTKLETSHSQHAACREDQVPSCSLSSSRWALGMGRATCSSVRSLMAGANLCQVRTHTPRIALNSAVMLSCFKQETSSLIPGVCSVFTHVFRMSGVHFYLWVEPGVGWLFPGPWDRRLELPSGALGLTPLLLVPDGGRAGAPSPRPSVRRAKRGLAKRAQPRGNSF